MNTQTNTQRLAAVVLVAPAKIYDSKVDGVVSPGHGIASGKTKDPRFPQGTVAPQLPHFKERGLDLNHCFPGTLDVQIAPQSFEVLRPEYTFRNVAWHPDFTEHFSFCSVGIETETGMTQGFLYYPHPETKKEFMDKPTQLQILAPKIPGLTYGSRVRIHFNAREFRLL